MTGFARSEGGDGRRRWAWELKSVNGRGLDIKLRAPSGLEALESALREALSARLKRGSIQANLTIQKDTSAGTGVRIDLDVVKALIAAGAPLVAQNQVSPPTWDGLLQVRGVVLSDDAGEESAEMRTALETALKASLSEAVDKLFEARAQEGKMLERVLRDLLNRIDALCAHARDLAGAIPGALSEKIRQRLAQLAPDLQFDPQRIAQEAALLASKADVTEELERLEAHVEEARRLFAAPEPAGRRLDFLTQELNREANTLCSKSGDLALTRIGLDLKTAIDQLKEQCANVE